MLKIEQFLSDEETKTSQRKNQNRKLTRENTNKIKEQKIIRDKENNLTQK